MERPKSTRVQIFGSDYHVRGDVDAEYIRTLAAFEGRDYAVPDDVVQLAIPALRHRVILTAEAEVEGHRVDDLLRELIRSVEVPRL